MDSKIILVKFPNNEFHTASVNRFVSIPIGDREIDTIWYIDLTERKNEEEEVGSYSLIRDNKDGTYTHLNCGTPENYEKIYSVLKEEIIKKNYINRDLSLLPYSIDTVEDYDFFEERNSPQKNENIIVSDNVENIKREISTRIGAFVDPYYTKAYCLMEMDLCVRLTLIEEKMSPQKWNETKDDIMSYLALKKLDMKKGYILIKDASDALNEIEELALNNLKDTDIEPVLIEDNSENLPPLEINDDPKELEEAVILPSLEIKEEPKEETEESLEENKENYQPYIKTIYVLWNELLSRLSDFCYYEYDSYAKMGNMYTISYNNITNEYQHINHNLLKLIDNTKISVDNDNIITINDQLTKYTFYIIPVDDYDLFTSLKESNNPYILTKDFPNPCLPIVNGIKRKNIIVTEKETLSIIN